MVGKRRDDRRKYADNAARAPARNLTEKKKSLGGKISITQSTRREKEKTISAKGLFNSRRGKWENWREKAREDLP